MSEFDWQKKFPQMRPAKSVPALFTLNGCGLMMHGRRDFDRETGTYVKTYTASFLFIPTFALSAYRVADAGNGGWYFVGKEPLSVLAKAWNALIVLVIAGAIGYSYLQAYWNSPEYLYGRKVDEAREKVAAGDHAAAAQLYRQVIIGRSKYSATAATDLSAWFTHYGADADGAALKEMLGAADLARSQNLWPGGGEALFKTAVELATKKAETDPALAISLVESVAGGMNDPEPVAAVLRPWISAWVQREPKNIAAVSRLATLHEQAQEFDQCKALLAPFGKELIGTEGGRIYGQLLASDGKFTEACDYLLPYCKERLTKLHAAEQEVNNLSASVESGAIAKLNNDLGPPGFQQRYAKASVPQQQQMVAEFVLQELKSNVPLDQAYDRLRDAASVVPVALDLGMILLQRAQQAASPKDRQKNLKQAEETFLAISGVAGGTDAYRLSYGQICYWLGKHEEGKKQFDDLLQSQNNKFETVINVAETLRMVGATTEARKLAEDAYQRETDPAHKQIAASLCAHLVSDDQERINWLERSNTSLPIMAAKLDQARGDMALRDGNDEQAAAFFQQSKQHFAKLDESSLMLNDSAFSFLGVFRSTGDPAEFKEAVRRLEKAYSMQPDNSVQLTNVAHMCMADALLELIGPRLDWQVLRQSPYYSMLDHLYDDEAGRKSLAEQLTASAGLTKSQKYFDQLLLLAPKSRSGYYLSEASLEWKGDAAALKQLIARIQEAQPDVTNQFDHTSEPGRKKIHEELRKAVVVARQRVERARAKNHPATLALCLGDWISARKAAAVSEPDPNHEELVAAAEEAVKLAPSLGARESLRDALQVQIAQQTPAWTAFAQQYAHLGHDNLFALALARNDELAAALKKHDKMAPLVQVQTELRTRCPQSVTVWDWRIAAAIDPEHSAEVAELVRKNEAGLLSCEVHTLLTDNPEIVVVRRYWRALLDGDQTAAQKVLTSAAERKMALPIP